jgi:hypothetical protein
MDTRINGVWYEVTDTYEMKMEDGQVYIYPLRPDGARAQKIAWTCGCCGHTKFEDLFYRTVDEAISAGLFRRKS